MLRLQKLEMIGFKSFFSRTEFHFDKDITAVVGPNGCGKSNIGDALNWVIGEQSVKSLRGDRMEDVIFNGSEGRKPLGMAEVSLHLKNGSEKGVDEQIVITRRLFRSGESEYLLNGEKKRLKDVQELLTRINIGSGVYSIIEQGKVDAALSSRPRDRRQLIEEAAGISIYKTRKRQAETKLEATEANLSRVNDIIAEIERQIRSLKRQAAKARRYTRTAGEIERRERILFYHDQKRLGAEQQEVSRREEEARRLENEAAALVSRLEALHEEQQRALADEDAEWRRVRDQLHQLDRDLDKHERDITFAREQTRESTEAEEVARQHAVELEEKLQGLAGEITARRSDREAVVRQVDIEELERERLTKKKEEAEDRITSLEGELTTARSAFLKIVDTLNEARNLSRQTEEHLERLGRLKEGLSREGSEAAEYLGQKSSVLRQLEGRLREVDEGLVGTRVEARNLTDRKDTVENNLKTAIAARDACGKNLHGLEERLKTLEEIEHLRTQSRELLSGTSSHLGFLSDGVKVEPQLEAAVDTYLADFLDAALVEDASAAVEGISSLKKGGRGRAAFLPTSGEDSDNDAPVVALPYEVGSDPGFIGRLTERIQADPQRSRVLARALSRSLVVRDLDSAMRLRRKAPFFDYITLDGDIVHTNGLIEGGAPAPENAGILSRRRAKADLLMTIEADRTKLAGLDQRIEGLESDKSTATASLAELTDALTAREKDVVSLRHKVDSAKEEETRARGKVDTIGLEIRQADEDSRTAVEEREGKVRQLAQLEQERNGQEEAIKRLSDDLSGLRDTASGTNEDLSAVRADLSASRQRLESVDNDLARILELDQGHRDRLEVERKRAEEMNRRIKEAAKLESDSVTALQEKGAARSDLSETVRRGEVELSEKRIASEERSQEVREARVKLEEARTGRETLSLEKERVASDLRHLEESATSDGSHSIDDLLASVSDEEKALEPETLKAELDELKQRRERMGPVNMMALDQFREHEERYEFLTSQRNDLTESIASLKETIAKINRTSRERFMDAFEKIRVQFNEFFSVLFGGGKSDLTLLTEESPDVLECGIEITAQPPGKRLQRVSLLSGGEKALTAIALLFAIFRYRPSPFCLLDEVDAPLDEANVIRFSDLLKSMSEKTQFVLITHNRGSMESADLLYGITMEEPGVSRTMSVVLDGSTDRAEAVKSLPDELHSRHKGNGRRPPAARAGQSDGNGGSAPVPPAG